MDGPSIGLYKRRLRLLPYHYVVRSTLVSVLLYVLRTVRTSTLTSVRSTSKERSDVPSLVERHDVRHCVPINNYVVVALLLRKK